MQKWLVDANLKILLNQLALHVYSNPIKSTKSYVIPVEKIPIITTLCFCTFSVRIFNSMKNQEQNNFSISQFLLRRFIFGILLIGISLFLLLNNFNLSGGESINFVCKQIQEALVTCIVLKSNFTEGTVEEVLPSGAILQEVRVEEQVIDPADTQTEKKYQLVILLKDNRRFLLSLPGELSNQSEYEDVANKINYFIKISSIESYRGQKLVFQKSGFSSSILILVIIFSLSTFCVGLLSINTCFKHLEVKITSDKFEWWEGDLLKLLKQDFYQYPVLEIKGVYLSFLIKELSRESIRLMNQQLESLNVYCGLNQRYVSVRDHLLYLANNHFRIPVAGYDSFQQHFPFFPLARQIEKCYFTILLSDGTLKELLCEFEFSKACREVDRIQHTLVRYQQWQLYYRQLQQNQNRNNSAPNLVQVHNHYLNFNPSIHQNQNAMANNTNDQSRNLNIGRDANLSGSTLNFGEISGSVTNTINQLPAASDPDRPGIKELLVQLQAVLESADEAALQPEDKADALEQVKVLAEAAQKPEDEKKTVGAKAIRFLRRIVDAVPTALPTASKLVEEVNKLVPAIVSLLGL